MHLQNQGEITHPATLFRVALAVYVDPGAGSYYFQVMITGLTTVFFFFASIRQKIRSLFKAFRRSSRHAEVPSREPVGGKPQDTGVLK
jgi:hypothetical protein